MAISCKHFSLLFYGEKIVEQTLHWKALYGLEIKPRAFLLWG